METYRTYTFNASEGILVIAYPEYEEETDFEFNYWVGPYQQPMDDFNKPTPKWYDFGQEYIPEDAYSIDDESIYVMRSLLFAMMATSCFWIFGYQVFVPLEWVLDAYNIYYLTTGFNTMWIAGISDN